MKRLAPGLRASFLGVALLLTTGFSIPVGASTDTVFFDFTGPTGADPFGGLISDSAGNLYGTTFSGGTFGAGTVFELMPMSGGYTEVVLYSFTGGADGGDPFASLVLDPSGNLFGTTTAGGTGGAGTVFELTPTGGGYTEVVIYSFSGGADGGFPAAPVILDASASNLYGTTRHGGTGKCKDSYGSGCGVVFALTTSGSETVLHSFTGKSDGALPMAPVLFDVKYTTLYGTTYQGGSGSCSGPSTGCGVAFKMTLAGKETVLHHFTGHTDGALPLAPLIFDNTKTQLYGTASAGGSTACKGGCGVVFRSSEAGTGFKVLHTFKRKDGDEPTAGLAFEISDKNLYGTTFLGGADNLGVVFELSTSGSGFTDLHNFSGSPKDGANPYAGLLFIEKPNSVPPSKGGCPPTCAGTSTQGGTDSSGTVYGVP